ncbi:uncharacterized protein LACBIDRAFT_334542 [Laccaria bicolor S238N-H82]|uniref:Predicted protein n=1 Tax=Laccaria bicolor (strain S238N-H82 / ATCC MYA-4686) TaxID=486041 RepID=B0DZH3_LACBS|nr:uncharacterized protein LACBIDRAFT_334542 [Laccaria bicolor S238N-H82]EDR00040.1 predicted protein [Laccaria bicolor S238N-H82]|eukprot:XP_001889349.1 predicted protein [Laccaria bicolor S238N-H82]
MDPLHFIGDNETGRESAVNHNIDTALPSAIFPEPASAEDITHTPTVQLSTSNSGAAPLLTDTLLSGATPPSPDTPPLTIEGPHSVTLPPADVKWPAWFGKAYTQLTSGNLGRTFLATILNYIEFEKHTSFGIRVAGGGFKIDKRPNEVGWWVACGHKVMPKITLKKLPAFEQAWWAWWKGLQPTACEAAEPFGWGRWMGLCLSGGLSDALHIPGGFQSFWQIPVPFQWNLPAKISLQPWNIVILVITPEQSLEWNGTGMQ